MLKLASFVSFIKDQKIQWVGHIVRRGKNEAVGMETTREKT